jgi:broad specificity phosphatase PhoE
MKMPGERGTRLVLVRHGETEWNRVERFRGLTDIELNETGRRQARALARRLSGWHVRAIYSSPLERALQTAQPIAEACGLEVAILEGMADVDYGEWAGLSTEEALALWPEVYETWAHTPLLTTFPGGESLQQVQERAWSALEEISAVHHGETVVLISHVVVNRSLICSALGLVGETFWRIGQDNAAINILQGANVRYQVLLLNDTCHLESLDGSRV